MTYSYEDINVINNAMSPTAVTASATYEAAYFRKYLFQRAMSVLKFRFPDHWAHDWTVANIVGHGFVIVVNHKNYGVIAQPGTLSGFDINSQPNKFTIARPLIHKTGRIGTDGFILNLQPGYTGLKDIISFYANKLAMLSCSIDVGLINSRLALLMIAGSKNAADTFKAIYDDVAKGEPAVVADSRLFSGQGEKYQVFLPNIGQNYITDRQLEDYTKIIQMFDTEIGINNVLQTKKANLTEDEVNVNNEEIFTKVDMWIDTFNRAAALINNAWGTNIGVEWRCKKEATVNAHDDGGAVQV